MPQRHWQVLKRMHSKWKLIEGYGGIYEISSSGDVRSLPRLVNYSDGRKIYNKGRILKQGITNCGYKKVSLYDKITSSYTTLNVHRLVAKYFIGDIEGLQVNHVDGDKLNNSESNLEIVSFEENMNHALTTGLHHNPRKKVEMLNTEMEVVNTFKSAREASRLLGKYQGNISKSCREGTMYLGHYWRYA